jgi:UDPglucose 6-dehydrogenase
MKVVAIGAGYVGLVSAAGFAQLGTTIVAMDNDPAVVAALQSGVLPILEPGLEDAVRTARQDRRLSFSASPAEAMDAGVVLLAVSTPARRSDGGADLSNIFAAVDSIAGHLKPGAVIATRSTVPAGTCQAIVRHLARLRPQRDVYVCSNPEFMREGSALFDFMNPERILIGSADHQAEAAMRALYEPLTRRGIPLVVTRPASAEIAKYAANAFLAMKVTFINQIADLCEQSQADVLEVADAIGRDSRIGNKYLSPGPGYGGPCIPKDVEALIRMGRNASTPLGLIEQLHLDNTERKRAMAHRIVTALGGDVRGKTIAVLGITFKPDTDDMRDAPSLTIVSALTDQGAIVRVRDPAGRSKGSHLLPAVTWHEDAYACADRADAVVVITDWP